MLHDLFYLPMPIDEKLFRSIIIYTGLVVAFRLFGKRELGQANTLDLVVLILVANAVQNGIIGNDVSVTGALIGALTLLIVNQLVSYGIYRMPFFEKVLE